MKNLRHFIKYLTPYKFNFALSVVFNFLYSLFSALSMLSLMPVMNVLFKEGEKVYEKPNFDGFSSLNKETLEAFMNYFITSNTQDKGAFSTLIWMMIFMIIAFFLKNLFAYMSMVYMTYLNNGVLKDLRNDVYNKVTSLHVSFFSGERKGDLISRMTADITTIKSSFMNAIMMIGREPLTLLFTLGAMLWISWKLTIFVLVFLPVAGFLISRLGRTIKNISGDIFALEGNLLSRIEETLGGIKIIKNFTAEAFFKNKFKAQSEEINHMNNVIGARMAMAGPLSEFLGVFTISILFVYGGTLVLLEETLTGGAFITYMGLAYQILTPAKAMAKASHAIQGGNAASERVRFILDAVNPLKDSEGAKVIQGFEKEIRFENVSFKYENEYVLKDFSLTVPKGKTVALVGESGSGKSTLANLVTRFYDVNEGNIFFDGMDIRTVRTESLRNQMGIVAQDSILFNDTIANNISLGVDNASEEAIVNAAKIANAHNFITEFERGYQTNVGDGGSSLSGGQRQRVAIARAVLKNPPIMILDEATSALDTESEKVVQDALENMMVNKTSIVIAHRLSTVKNADLIIVMKKGRILEQGTHQELIAMGGMYSKLVSLQSLEVLGIEE
ncbi:ABC transporter ATP-binding protein [Wenyingzhuangia sp. 2_MG-2023]|uniref:ABC transporter ATP-binding protein n=1 Tax=Wenyingzhuangia sp. 2_MG-2023 TaxID=3062639 RepID=UPI0026E33349|nr:ABC transporter ATP-binding protein [Wenyingzhuangia sp. 2_MG-2023]MDO6738425.1 ABC transporter ATP-binding protein [Wenyingzhuangia sp. 2_MG-2023]MDO6803352.1 ABC transporter ATP-binding protein [Wenyingzhuangia sp. 1_MG-2023]